MTIYYPTFKPAISSLTMVTRTRELPFAGEVLVRVGNRVEPDQVVARTLVPQRGRRFAVARTLGIADDRLARHVLLEDGAEVESGDSLVRVGRWRQRVWRCPIDGTLSLAEVERGYLIVIPPAEVLELRAHLKGFVSAVQAYRSVTIQTPATLVQGAFGLGRERHGVLRTAVTDEADPLTADMLDERSAFSVLIGGGPISVEALDRAIELQVRGLIVGSISEADLRTFLGYRGDADWAVGAAGWGFPPRAGWRDPPLTLVVTEGLGQRAMCKRAFELLASYDGSEVLLDGRTWLHGPRMRRPQLVVPLLRADAASVSEERTEEQLLAGSQVRLLGADRLGQMGTVVELPRRRRFSPGGARYYVAAVRLDDGEVVDVPLENLEVLE